MSDRTRKVFIPISILIIGLLIAIGLVKAYPDAEKVKPEAYRPLVRYQVVEPSSVKINVASQGTVVPRTQSNIVAQVGGQIVFASPKFAAGGFFEKDEVMLKVESADYKLAKIRTELQVAQAELSLIREEEESALAKAEWEKVGTGNPSSLVMRDPQLKQARASLNAARAGLDQAIINLNRTVIKAPYACRVRSKQADIGQVVNIGSAVAMVYAIDYAEVRLPLPDADMAFIDLPYSYRGGASGRKPSVDLTAVFAGKEYSWQGELVRIEGEIDPRSRMINAVARVKNPYGKNNLENKPPLSVGMFVSANISGRQFDNIFEIKRAALHSNNKLWIIDEDNKLFLREVEILRQESNRVLITNGIKSGEKVCLTSLDAVVDGMEVRIEE